MISEEKKNLPAKPLVGPPARNGSYEKASAEELARLRRRAEASSAQRTTALTGALDEADDDWAQMHAVAEEEQRVRTLTARAETARRNGLMSMATYAATGTAVTIAACALLGPVGGALALLGGLAGIKVLGGKR